MSGGFLASGEREDELFYALAQELDSLPADNTELKPEDELGNALASIVETLTKCAEKLEAVGHPSLEQVDNVLSFIDTEFFASKN